MLQWGWVDSEVRGEETPDARSEGDGDGDTHAVDERCDVY